jgi:hypothetical protein
MWVSRWSCALVLALTGCGTYPVTDGFHKTLPQRDTRIVVWGGHQSASGAATIWLQKRGLSVVERTRLQQVFDEQRLRLTQTPDDDAQLLKVGKLIGADTVAFIDTPIAAGHRGAPVVVMPQGGSGGGFFGGLAQGSAQGSAIKAARGAGTVYTTSVSIRGVNVETSEVLWSGTARYTSEVRELDNTLVQLTCQALATAWGMRPAGQKAISSQDMCDAAH